jgi:hypothetical protein
MFSDSMMNRRLLALLIVFAGLSAASCRRPADENDSRPQRPRTASKPPYLIEGDELKVETATNLYDVVRIQRPAWLTRDRDGIVVYLNERKVGLVAVLRQLPVNVAQSIQFLSPAEAQLRFGPLHGGSAAIVVQQAR